MITNIVLMCVIFCLCILNWKIHNEKAKYEKQIKDLKDRITLYDSSRKVIKNCVVYTPDEPITLSGHHMTFIECRFEHLGMNPATKELKEYLELGKKKRY